MIFLLAFFYTLAEAHGTFHFLIDLVMILRAATGLSDNFKGAILMVATMLAYTLNDGMMKYLFADMDLFQAVLLRGVLTLPLLGLFLWYRRALLCRLSSRDWRFVALRVGAEIGATVAFLTALKHMPLANVAAILQALPLAVTMAAALFLHEPVGWRRWSAILVGFAGVLIVIRPGMEGFSVYSLYVLGAVGFITLREITTRQLSPKVPSLTVVVSTSVGITIVGAVMMPTIAWSPVSPIGWLALAGAAGAVVFGYLFSVMAMRVGDISFVAPFRYTSMIWAICLGVIMFGDWPDTMTLVGTVVIVVTGIYSFHREQVRNQSAKT